jgi:hypothetical protein
MCLIAPLRPMWGWLCAMALALALACPMSGCWLLAAGFGIGFLQDRQYPQLGALFRDDIRADEDWRLALLSQWRAYATRRGGAFAPEQTRARLHRLADLIQHSGMPGLAGDPAALFFAIDPAKAGLHDRAAWHAIRAGWQADFNHVVLPGAPVQLDYACALAFCCGQHFAYDPLWDSLADLRPESLFAFLN